MTSGATEELSRSGVAAEAVGSATTPVVSDQLSVGKEELFESAEEALSQASYDLEAFLTYTQDHQTEVVQAIHGVEDWEEVSQLIRDIFDFQNQHTLHEWLDGYPDQMEAASAVILAFDERVNNEARVAKSGNQKQALLQQAIPFLIFADDYPTLSIKLNLNRARKRAEAASLPFTLESAQPLVDAAEILKMESSLAELKQQFDALSQQRSQVAAALLEIDGLASGENFTRWLDLVQEMTQADSTLARLSDQGRRLDALIHLMVEEHNNASSQREKELQKIRADNERLKLENKALASATELNSKHEAAMASDQERIQTLEQEIVQKQQELDKAQASQQEAAQRAETAEAALAKLQEKMKASERKNTGFSPENIKAFAEATNASPEDMILLEMNLNAILALFSGEGAFNLADLASRAVGPLKTMLVKGELPKYGQNEYKLLVAQICTRFTAHNLDASLIEKIKQANTKASPKLQPFFDQLLNLVVKK